MKRGLIASCVAAAVVAAATADLRARQSSPPPDRQALLARVAAYLKTYEKQFSAVVAEEAYGQTVAFRSGTSTIAGLTPRHQELRSDVMVLNLGSAQWLQFRDVYEVNEKPVRDHQSRPLALLQGPSRSALSEAQAIANESARFNVGVMRNINVPTMAVTYLTAENQSRSTFDLAGVEAVRGAKAVVIKFRETAAPSLIHDPAGNVATSGRGWVDPASGAVLRTELSCLTPSATRVVVTVDYGAAPGARVLVPIAMEEQYTLASGEIDSGKATYSNFRSFEVDTSALFRGGGGQR